MTQHKTRLLVVVDPTETHQVALVKALLIAKLGDCHIHAFLCTYKDMKQADKCIARRFQTQYAGTGGRLAGTVDATLQSQRRAIYDRSRLE